MEGLQTTGIDETTLFTEADLTADLKGMNKKHRKELFQINTHPAAVVQANNKRDRRLKKIVMRVVAFCKKEHEEGQQIPFRFFKKRASVMTGVSLSTIHRIETIDMRASSPDPDTSKTTKTKKDGVVKKSPKKKKKKEAAPTPAGVTEVQLNAASMAEGVSAGTTHLIQYSDITNIAASQIHFQTLPAVATVQPQASTIQAATKPAKKNTKKKIKTEEAAAAAAQSPAGVACNHSSNATIITTNINNMQPAAMPSLAGIGGEAVTTINVHNAVAAGNVAADRGHCTWTTGPIGPFAMGDLRDNQQVQVHGAPHVQVGAQSMPVATAIPVGAQLQPISVAAAGSHQTFTGQIDTSNWPPGSMGAFGALQGTATLVGQQVVQTYQNNPGHTNHPQQQQQSPVFYQF